MGAIAFPWVRKVFAGFPSDDAQSFHYVVTEVLSSTKPLDPDTWWKGVLCKAEKEERLCEPPRQACVIEKTEQSPAR